MTYLDLLHALEEVRDTLGPAHSASGPFTQAYLVAHRACEAAYASLQAEADEMEQAFQKATRPPVVTTPREIKEANLPPEIHNALRCVDPRFKQ